MTRRIADILYLASGILIALGGLGHSFGAVGQVQAALENARIDPRTLRLLLAVWHFAGAAMVVLGALAAADWWALRRRADVPGTVPVLLGGFYVAYGLAALAWMREPFWAIFVVYGLMAGIAGRLARRP